MLAQIALGLAVVNHDIDGFKPLVRDFILSKPEQAAHWWAASQGCQSRRQKSKARVGHMSDEKGVQVLEHV